MAQYLAPLFLIVAGTSAQTSEGSGSDTTNGVLNITEPDFELLVKLHGEYFPNLKMGVAQSFFFCRNWDGWSLGLSRTSWYEYCSHV